MMFKGHSRAVRARKPASNVTKAPLRKGLFSDGIWKCNCDPRLPAQHFQTKNGGNNHGRWCKEPQAYLALSSHRCRTVYVCQLPQTKRCDFFIWDDEARTREAAVVLNNSRSEPYTEPVTPAKETSYGLPTPQTERHIQYPSDGDIETPYTPSKPPRDGIGTSVKPNGNKDDTQYTTATSGMGDDEFFDWPASDDEEINKAVDRASQDASLPETPRKSMKTDALASPGKRRFADISPPQAPGTALSTLTSERNKENDIFMTPATSKKGSNLFTSAPPSTTNTPSRIHYADLSLSPAQDFDLATEILNSLQKALSVPLYTEAREELKEICNRHTMQARGIMKGRDVSRAIVKKKEERILDLQREIEGLRSERETERSAIRSLRQELAVHKQRN